MMCGFPGGPMVKNSPPNAGDMCSIPGLGRPPGGGAAHWQRSLMGYSPWGHKESDMTERLTHINKHTYNVS